MDPALPELSVQSLLSFPWETRAGDLGTNLHAEVVQSLGSWWKRQRGPLEERLGSWRMITSSLQHRRRARGKSLETSSLIRAKQRGNTPSLTHTTSSAGEINPWKTGATDVTHTVGVAVFHVTHQILSLSNPSSIAVHSLGPKFTFWQEKITSHTHF